MRLLVLASSVLLIALHTPAIPQTSPRRTTAWTTTECGTFKVAPPADSGVECGYVSVPRRHSEPDGSAIQLATVILPSHAADRKADPLFIAQGGPGGSSIETYVNYFLNQPDSRPALDRDLVVWDQRGTLY